MDKYLQVRNWIRDTWEKTALRWTATCILEASYAAHKERISQDEKLFSIHFLLVSLLDWKNKELSTVAYTFIFDFVYCIPIDSQQATTDTVLNLFLS